ncbi:BTAD domain-containing putative transcriptional regulator [Actinosynnema sp. NPDC050801]|uniref:AfsR/SARP family transcriptional regulator n=1 Tax=unclassified Actinosynnema TaxID=2637065 RepID=UPI0033C4DF68
MEFRVLGPVQARVEGGPVEVGGPKPRTLLALLAVNVGRVVAVEQLVDALWGERPPGGSRSAIYTYVSTLRRELGDVLVRSGGGYLLSAEPDQVDLHVFTARVDEGRRSLAENDLEGAAARFAAALDVWRGVPLGGAQGAWAEGERSRLEELRSGALEDRFDADLALGRGEALVSELTAAVAEHPLRERLRSQLMLALSQAGRRAEALAAYQEGRRVLLDELGLEPGLELRSTHERVLRGPTTPEARSTPEAGPPPSQLPFDVADFTGRMPEHDRLVAHLTTGRGAMRVCAISGQPGAGKSTLAAHVAHAMRGHFTDGQLYANLRGVHPVPADPAEVLAGFLRALGVSREVIPADLEERAQLYRTLLADRRVLVVLDDVRDERQIRPLLPGGTTCAVLTTSRERLGALSGAAHLELGVMRDAEALELLDRVVGDGRVAAESKAAEDIVRLCGRLPLALRIAGARLAARPQWRLARLAERLGVKRRVLQELAVGDLEVRGSLALSYDGLAERERAALRRLAVLDVATFGGWLVAPLLDSDPREAEEVVERLVDSRLLDLATTDGGATLRYRMHDLTRAFARERGEAEQFETAVRTACAHAARTWLALLDLAKSRVPHTALDGNRDRTTTDHPHFDPDAAAEIIADPEARFDAEQAGLVGVVERVSELDLTDGATRLAALCSSRFSVRDLFDQWWRTHSAALEAARRVGDRAGEARPLSALGWLRHEQDRFEEAASYYGQALEAYRETGDVRGEASTRLALSAVLREHGELTEATEMLDLALPALRELGEKRLVAQASHELGRVLTEQGHLDLALEACEQTVRAYRAAGDRRGEGIAVRSMSTVHRAAERWDLAAEYAARAVEILRTLGDRLMSAYAVQALAKVRIRQGRGDAVRSDLLECLSTCNEMQDRFGQALVLRTLGELELAGGRPEAARRYLDRSLHWWESLSLPVWRARTLRDLAAALAASGEPEAAEAAWREADGIFRAHGCREASEPSRPALGTSHAIA